MSDHNHTGSIWGNVGVGGVKRHSGPPFDDSTVIVGGNLKAGQQLIVLCYTLGPSVLLPHPIGPEPTLPSNAWDFVVTSDQDSGGYVNDVFINTGGDIRQQLGAQGTCEVLQKSLSGGIG